MKLILEQGQDLNAFFKEGGVALELVSGVIRVIERSGDGRELTLCRLSAGEYLLHFLGEDFAVFGDPVFVVEQRVEGLTAPKSEFDLAMATDPQFRTTIIKQLQAQNRALTSLVRTLGFFKVDERLAEWLAYKCISGLQRITITHQELADHLASSREVVSRILKDWEQKDFVKLERGMIILLPAFRPYVSKLLGH